MIENTKNWFLQSEISIKKWHKIFIKKKKKKSQSATEVYYKVHQVLQSVTEFYYKVCKLLQSVTDHYYKVHQVLQSVTGCYYKVRDLSRIFRNRKLRHFNIKRSRTKFLINLFKTKAKGKSVDNSLNVARCFVVLTWSMIAFNIKSFMIVVAF